MFAITIKTLKENKLNNVDLNYLSDIYIGVLWGF